MTKKKKAVAVLVSGGIDSSLLLAEMAHNAEEVFPVYVRSGYRWEEAELHWLHKLIGAIDAPMLSPLIILESPMKESPSFNGIHNALEITPIPRSQHPNTHKQPLSFKKGILFQEGLKVNKGGV